MPKMEMNEITRNELWREAIQVENEALKKHKPKYACNLNMLECSHITPKIGSKTSQRKELTDDDHARAEAILQEFGVKTIKRDPYKIEMPPTSNGGYGAYAFFAIPDEHRSLNAKNMCEVTKYADNYYNLTGTTPYSKSG